MDEVFVGIYIGFLVTMLGVITLNGITNANNSYDLIECRNNIVWCKKEKPVTAKLIEEIINGSRENQDTVE